MASDDLHKPLKAINKTIARLREDVQTLTGEVKKIATVVEEAAETIRDAIQENIRAQAELKLMEHVMEVRSVKPQITAEHEQIRTERDELDERLEAIGDRYERKHEELDEKARRRIRNLGEHIFEIDEQMFEVGIEEPFVERVTTTWKTLRSHNDVVREERSSKVQETVGDVVQTIHDFIDRQDALVDTIQQHRLDPAETPLPEDRTDRLQVPYYVVEYETDGVTQREVVVPSKLSTDTDSEWAGVTLDPITGADDLLDGVSGVDDPARSESLSASDLGAALEQYGESSVLAPSYGDAAAEATPGDGSIPVRIEGGER